jgi:hypothetical protein
MDQQKDADGVPEGTEDIDSFRRGGFGKKS